MSPPRVPSLALGVALASVGGCWCGGWVDGSEAIELGVDVDLHAVTGLGDLVDGRVYRGLAVGAEGTVVAWGSSEEDYERFVERTTIADVDLRGTWTEPGAWWVVGGAGTLAVSGDQGQSWSLIELTTDADLYAITSVGSRLVVVGDDVVLTQSIDGSWSETPGDWGQLRGVYSAPWRTWAVGLGGVIWSTEDPSGEWIAEPSGVEADLLAVGSFHGDLVAVGAAGTLLIREADGWDRVKTREDVDLIAYHGQAALGAGGELFELRGNNRVRLEQVDQFPGARALSRWGDAVIVGDDGLALVKQHFICGY